MGRPKGSKQKTRSKIKYWLPEGIVLKEGQTNIYDKNTKLIFIDPEFGEFTSYYRALQQANASTHPSSVMKRRSETNITRYGNVCNLQSSDVREKVKNNMMNKYGVENPSQAEEIKRKKEQTSQKNYGVNNPMQSDLIKLKQKEAVENKYGVSNVMQIPEIQNKMRDIMVENGYAELLPNGLTLEQTFKAYNLPFLSRAFTLRNEFGGEFALNWIKNRKERVSSLELLFKEIYPEAQSYQKVPVGLKNYRPDFKIKDIFIDVDGLLYHSDKFKEEKNFHLNKAKNYRKCGHTLLQFRQNEILDKEDIVKSIINAKIGNLSNRLYARKTEIKEHSLKEANEFFERTHLMGRHPSARAVGLFIDNKIVCCISYRKYKTGLDISRFSCELNTVVIGGLSKLLNYIKNKENPDFIQSFVDLRYGSGDSLLTLGFKLDNITLGWKWTDGYRTFNRMTCMANMDERKLSEKEHAAELKLNRIYDAGQAKFIIKYKL